ncbi:hypothetical protein BH09ACT10_BH09ACT10_19490 [soil metagenome]
MRRWPYTFAVALSVAIGLTTIITAKILDLPLKDPEGFLGPAYVRLPLIVLAFLAADVIPRSLSPRLKGKSPYARCKFIIEEQWSWVRLLHISVGLGTFYACYVSYRNLKSFLPVIREGKLDDKWMLNLDHFLMFGNNPATILHSVLGTGASAQILSTLYILYLTLIPLSLGAMLVWSRDMSLGCWYATALCLNWVLGVISYYLVPTLGPAFAQPQSFWELPNTGASALQNSLFSTRLQYITDPSSVNGVQGIAGFASLHVSVVVTGCLFATRVGAKRVLRYILWGYLVCTVLATIYFGWHYIADDIAGAMIGWAAVSIAAVASGNRGVHMLRKPKKSKAESDLALS